MSCKTDLEKYREAGAQAARALNDRDQISVMIAHLWLAEALAKEDGEENRAVAKREYSTAYLAARAGHIAARNGYGER